MASAIECGMSAGVGAGGGGGSGLWSVCGGWEGGEPVGDGVSRKGGWGGAGGGVT